VINFEPPWNPARLEQRIGRVHRLGQAHPVHVVHLLTKDSIEERVWETLKLKKSLFAGVFDSPTGEVSFAKLGRKSVLQTMKEIFANQPGRPKPIVDQAPPKAVPAKAAGEPAPPPAVPPQLVAPVPALSAHGLEKNAGALIETGLRFLESLAAIVQSTPADTTAEQPIWQRLSSLVSHDQNTGRKTLSIPLPQSIDEDRLTRAIAGVLSAFGRSA
jgi:hypothetical protein